MPSLPMKMFSKTIFNSPDLDFFTGGGGGGGGEREKERGTELRVLGRG